MIAAWAGADLLLVYVLPILKGWNVYNSFYILPYIISPLAFALMGKRLHGLNNHGITWLYLAAFVTALLVSAASFGHMAIYSVTNRALNTLEFMLFDGGGRVSFYFWGLALIHMAVMLPIFRCRKMNMLSRILTAVLSAPAVIFLGFYAMELFGYGEFYINHWWWTAVCTLIYWASLGIYLLIKSKNLQ